MGTTLTGEIARLAPERRERIEAEADRLHARPLARAQKARRRTACALDDWRGRTTLAQR
jgi:hypothetical protein